MDFHDSTRAMLRASIAPTPLRSTSRLVASNPVRHRNAGRGRLLGAWLGGVTAVQQARGVVMLGRRIVSHARQQPLL